MVAIFVVMTILVFLIIDYGVQKVQRRRAAVKAVAVPSAASVPPWKEGLPISADSLSVPSSLFFHRGHSWIKFTSPRLARVGLDDFTQKVLGSIDSIQLPRIGEPVRQGDPLFMLRVGEHKVFLPAPSDGIVSQVNTELATHPQSLHQSPYDAGWICEMRPENISKNVRELLVGDDAVNFELHELSKLHRFLEHRVGKTQTDQPKELYLARGWAADCKRDVLNEFSKAFFTLDPEQSQLLTEVS